MTMDPLGGEWATLEQIREEHYPLMVLRLAEYIKLHGDPAIVQRALIEAARSELARMQRLAASHDQ